MNTDAILKSSVRLSVAFEGQPPIDSSAIILTSEQNAQITNTSGQIFAKRIVYSDLETSGSNRVFQIIYGAGTFSETLGVQNLVGEYFDIENGLSFVYLKTNAAATSSGSIPVPATISAGTEFLRRGTIVPDPEFFGSDTVINITWTQAAIEAVGTGNFYCDLILANS